MPLLKQKDRAIYVRTDQAGQSKGTPGLVPEHGQNSKHLSAEQVINSHQLMYTSPHRLENKDPSF